MIQRQGSSLSLQSTVSGAQQQWKRSSGMPVQIQDNKAITTLTLKQDVMKKYRDADDNLSELQIDLGHFRYIADKPFVDQIMAKHRINYANSNSTHFQCVVNNGAGQYDKNSIQTQTFAIIDIIYSFLVGTTQYFVYGQTDKIGQFIEVPLAHKIEIGFGVFTNDNQIVKPDIDFGNTNYILNFFIE